MRNIKVEMSAHLENPFSSSGGSTQNEPHEARGPLPRAKGENGAKVRRLAFFLRRISQYTYPPSHRTACYYFPLPDRCNLIR